MRVFSLKRFAVACVMVVLAWGNFASGAVAKDADSNNAASPGDADSGAAKKPVPKGAKDPVVTAFKLPSGVTLNSRQKAAYEALKAAKEDELRSAFDDVQNAQAGAATAQALKKVKETRAEIRQAIDEIVSGTGPVNVAGPNSSGSGYESPGYVPYATGFGYGGGYYPPYGYYPNGRYPYNYKPGSGKGSPGGTSYGPNSGAKSPPPTSRPASRPAPAPAKH